MAFDEEMEPKDQSPFHVFTQDFGPIKSFLDLDRWRGSDLRQEETEQ